VRVKIDENLPESAVTVVRAAGHDVDTVRDEGLTGAADSEVISIMEHLAGVIPDAIVGFIDKHLR